MEGNNVSVNKADFGTLAVCAIRYCQGRQTYMPSMVCEIVLRNVQELSNRDLWVIIEDCKRQERNGNWGSDLIDKPMWVNFKKSLEEEWKRRKPNG